MAESHSSVVYRMIPDYPGYRVGTDGSVWSCLAMGKCATMSNDWHQLKLTPCLGYLYVSLRRTKNGKRGSIFRRVHGLVLTCFVGPCPPGLECGHRDRDKRNNNLSNLRWVTKLENAADKHRHGTTSRGELHGRAKLTSQEVLVAVESRRAGESYASIGRRLGVDWSTIYDIDKGFHWSHITGIPRRSKR